MGQQSWVEILRTWTLFLRNFCWSWNLDEIKSWFLSFLHCTLHSSSSQSIPYKQLIYIVHVKIFLLDDKKLRLFGYGINAYHQPNMVKQKKSQEVGVVEAMKNVGKTNWEWETNGGTKQRKNPNTTLNFLWLAHTKLRCSVSSLQSFSFYLRFIFTEITHTTLRGWTDGCGLCLT